MEMIAVLIPTHKNRMQIRWVGWRGRTGAGENGTKRKIWGVVRFGARHKRHLFLYDIMFHLLRPKYTFNCRLRPLLTTYKLHSGILSDVLHFNPFRI